MRINKIINIYKGFFFIQKNNENLNLETSLNDTEILYIIEREYTNKNMRKRYYNFVVPLSYNPLKKIHNNIITYKNSCIIKAFNI